MIKFFDLIGFKEIFHAAYREPPRKPKLGHYSMVVGLLMLLFIGFNRIWHFTYIRLDAILCGFFRLPKLPVASTFWRYIDSMGINQAQSLLKLMSILRERVWQQLGFSFDRICIDIDTTVETLYGNQQGGQFWERGGFGQPGLPGILGPGRRNQGDRPLSGKRPGREAIP
jgi:hypothetical protein